MRYIAILLAVAFLHGTLAAQHIETLVRGNDEWSFFIQPELKTTRISDKSAQLMGLRLGPALDRTLHLGLAGYALISSIDPDSVVYKRLTTFDLWAVGLTMDYTFIPNRWLHPGIGCF
ncbi:MAG: hypothetical protein LC725_11235, partial [Lentisphaerae bacterium]|nr:hypothetical protein [Lentisphaerota bacterium]